MSRIYFHSPSGHVEVYGRERAWMDCLTRDIAGGVLCSRFRSLDLAHVLPAEAYPREALTPERGSAQRFAEALSLWIGGHDSAWRVGGEEYDCFSLNLNTAWSLGSDAVRLCARLHGQCEIHAYVEGPNRAWLAGVIQSGVRDRVLRDEDSQWTKVAEWLLANADEPAVTSYSVCEQFPNASVAKQAGLWSPGDGHHGVGEDGREWWDGDEWYELPAEKKWELGMQALRSGAAGGGLEMRPGNWATFRFGHCKDAMWLWERAAEAKKGG